MRTQRRRQQCVLVLIFSVLLAHVNSTDDVYATPLAYDEKDEVRSTGDYPLLDALDALEESGTPNLRHGRRLKMMFPFFPPAAAPLPPKLPRAIDENLAVITEPITEQDTAFYWHIPKAGGSTMKAYYGKCLHKVQAREVGGLVGSQDKSLEIIKKKGHHFVNVDLSNPEGIKRAKRMHLAESGYAEIAVSTYLYDVADLFNPVNRGRFFTVFRHPIERAVSLFYYRQTSTWEKDYDEKMKTYTMAEFFKMGRGEKNWVVRILANKPTKRLTGEDLEIAKEVLRTRCLVGMMDRMKESLDRFDAYFGWSSAEGEQCKNQLLNQGVNSNSHAGIEVGSEIWNILYDQNELDIKLYEYAQVLFEEQRALFDFQNLQR